MNSIGKLQNYFQKHIIKMKGNIYIVHHVDTEGPLFEPVVEIFKRLDAILGIDLNLSANLKNLKLLQQGLLIQDKELSKTIQKIVDPHLISFKSNWNEIDEMLVRITSQDFRKKYKDSFGNGWVYNWHLLDHVGFNTNERRRDIGYSNVYKHYNDFFKEHLKGKDDFQWHFHPISFKKEAHKCATSFVNSYHEINQIMSRRIIDEHWFPQVNRAGFHTERPDSNWFLEQWMPFDASNQSMDNEVNKLQSDAINGRFGDWNNAPSDWSIYNPDLYDWRRKGNLNRYISRVLNLNTRFRNINKEEVEKAFIKAQSGQDVYLGVTNHDFREMSNEIHDFYKILIEVSNSFPDIKFINENSLNTFRCILNYSESEIEKNKLDFNATLNNNVLKIEVTNGEPFGPQPYLAIKTINGEYYHDNFDFGIFKKEYFYTFDSHTFNIKEISNIAIASNDKYGNCLIKNIKL